MRVAGRAHAAAAACRRQLRALGCSGGALRGGLRLGLRVKRGTRDVAGQAGAGLSVTDARTGRVVPLPVAPGGLLRMRLHLPPDPAGPTGLRVLLVADVLLRATEAEGVQVSTCLAAPEPAGERAAALDRAMAALNIHPPADVLPGHPVDLHIACGGDPAGPGLLMAVGQIRAEEPGGGAPDPLALRLALLGRAYGEPAAVTADDLAEAERTLARWRRRVADWARSPSRPVPPGVRDRAAAALAFGLGTPGVLGVLRDVEEAPDIADGARFETFAAQDRVLGLDLARDVGRW